METRAAKGKTRGGRAKLLGEFGWPQVGEFEVAIGARAGRAAAGLPDPRHGGGKAHPRHDPARARGARAALRTVFDAAQWKVLVVHRSGNPVTPQEPLPLRDAYDVHPSRITDW